MEKLETLIWCNTILAIFGTILNAKRIRFGFVIWMITNAAFVVYNFHLKSYAQSTLFFVYFGLALYGWINWGKQDKKAKNLIKNL
ncbi:MAG: nicotinamide mononucleotide transporter [Parachlamydiales bacterium]|nr:nicotinamide mononucleotide transporter [Parachlamydiales bacterium]